MVIKPEYKPEIFLKIFGEYDASTLHPDWVWIQRERAKAWDAAIEHALLHKDLQQPVLTHPVVQSCTHQPKGD